MFDELDDPTPPSADSSQLAAVAERAASMRRRRHALIGTVSAVALVGVGVIGVSGLASNESNDLLMTGPDTGLETTTTELAIASTTDFDTTTSTSEPAAVVTTPVATAAIETTATTDPDLTSTTSSEVTTTTSSAVTTTSATFDTLPPRPLVAIDGNGDAVYLPADVDRSSPLRVVDDGVDPDEIDPNQEGTGPNVVDAVAVAETAGEAWIGECCEPAGGNILINSLDGTSTNRAAVGYSPSLSPSGRKMAAGQGNTLAVNDLESGELIIHSPPSDLVDYSFTPYDVMWLDNETVLLLGIGDDGWNVITFDLTTPLGSERRSDRVADFTGLVDATYLFAGTPEPGRVAIHERGSDTVEWLEFTGTGVERADLTVDLPGPSRTAWYGPDRALIRVDADGVLHVGDDIVAGTYTWARR